MAQVAMKALPFLIGGIVGGVGSLLSKPPKPVSPPPMVTPNMAADAAMSDTMMRQRRGAGATELVGRGAGEARSPGGKVLLGQ